MTKYLQKSILSSILDKKFISLFIIMKKIFVYVIICIIFISGNNIPSSIFAQNTTTSNNIPAEYYPDPHLSNKMDTLVQTIVTLQATTNAWKDPEPSIFQTLNVVFNDVLQYFPQTPTQQIIYEQCKITTADLSKKYEYNNYITFREKCLWPINSIISQIKGGSTIKTEITAIPKEWPAPLNVTFDARNSRDPSWDTIPSDQFYRYYKDSKGNNQVIGRGVIVNHTFPEPWNYIVHLTVRSVNNLSKGIFDGTNQINVNVGPQVVRFGVYVNGVKGSINDTMRVGSQEALDGIIIDGTATVPTEWRTIKKHSWRLTWEEKFEIKKSDLGNPGQFSAKLPRNGSYLLELEITDNQNNTSKESYQISVSDPVANIKFNPKENGTTSLQYNFDAGASYSLTSKIAKYQWTITDPDGNIINNEESKTIKRKFAIPGRYTSKLTVTDELGNTSFDSEKFYVNSTPPIAAFTIRPFVALKQPSQFIFDASPSFDEDVRQWSDALLYKRTFIPQENVTIEKELNGWKQLIVSFQQPWSYKAKLTVTDQFWQSVDTDKEIKVESSLRPELLIPQWNVQLGNNIDLKIQANKDISLIERDFGDGSNYKWSEASIQKEYKKSGVFIIKAKVSTPEGESNEISKNVFIGQKDFPLAAYEVFNESNQTMDMTHTCKNQDGVEVPAYNIDRYKMFTINANTSTDTQWWSTKLKVSLKPDDDAEITNKSQMNYNFKEVGCHSIDIVAEDIDRKVSDSKKARFYVQNALPTLDRLDISFPQQASSSSNNTTQWIGLWWNTAVQKLSITEMLSDEKIDNIIVKLQGQNIKDPDWFLSHLVRYYYRVENPERLLEAKVTPGNIQFVNFSIPKPRQPWEYWFWVKLVDNDKWENTSEQLLWGRGPSLFFPANANNPDIPIVSVKINKSVSKIWEEIEVSAESSILSNRSDFQELRYFKYDFDGDGMYDLTSKNTSATWKYEKSWNYTPKVAVYYRERLGIGRWEEIQVQEWLEPVYEIVSFDKKVLVKDFSIGDIENTDICMDIKLCSKDPLAKISNKKVFLYEYPQYDNYLLKARIVDKYGNLEWYSKEITLTPGTGFGILSIPHASKNDSGYTISLGNNINNTLHIYIASDPKEKCYMDTDITIDSDKDGDPSNDLDRSCNQLLNKEFQPKTKLQYATIIHGMQWEINKEQVTFEFLDIEDTIPSEYQAIVSTIDELIVSLEGTTSSGENKNEYVRTLLVNLKKWINEKEQVDSILLQINDILTQNPNTLNTQQQDSRVKIMQSLGDSDVTTALWLWIYELNKQNIIVRFEDLAKEEVIEYFKEFEVNNGNKQAMKLALDKIWQKALAELQAWNMDSLDMNYIKKWLCDIAIYYELPAKSCDGNNTNDSNDNTETVSATNQQTDSGWSSVLSIIIKIILIIAGILLLIFIVFFIIWVIKAKKEKQKVSE